MNAEWISGHAIVPEWPVTAGRQRVVCADQAGARIAHLEGQRDVLTGLLGEALKVLEIIVSDDADEFGRLSDIEHQIASALAAIAAEKAQKGPT